MGSISIARRPCSHDYVATAGTIWMEKNRWQQRLCARLKSALERISANTQAATSQTIADSHTAAL